MKRDEGSEIQVATVGTPDRHWGGKHWFVTLLPRDEGNYVRVKLAFGVGDIGLFLVRRGRVWGSSRTPRPLTHFRFDGVEVWVLRYPADGPKISVNYQLIRFPSWRFERTKTDLDADEVSEIWS